MKRILVALAILTAALAIPSTASAVVCGGTLVTLSTDNLPNASLSVTFCRVGNTFTLVDVSSNIVGLTKFFEIDWQNSGVGLDVTQGGGDGVGGDTGWTFKNCPPGPGNCGSDGFGNPNSDWGGAANGSPAFILGSDTLVFYFTGDPGYLGVHLGGAVASCSGWTTNGPFTGDAGSPVSSECVAQVPEPATLLLFGVGLLGLAGLRRRLS